MRSWGALGGPKSKKQRKTWFVTVRSGTSFGAFFSKDLFFHKKVCSWSVFFANRFFIKFWSDFWLIFDALEPQKHKF